jgi:SAM-dependent methyltransferase
MSAPLPRLPDVVYVATPDFVVDSLIDAAGLTAADVVYDLGCGDGRIVIAAAQRGARAVGVDIDPARIAEATANASAAGVADRVTVVEADMFNVDLHAATVVVVYLLPSINIRLRPKLWRELPPGARVVSHEFDMGDWPPTARLDAHGRVILQWTVGRESDQPEPEAGKMTSPPVHDSGGVPTGWNR